MNMSHVLTRAFFVSLLCAAGFGYLAMLVSDRKFMGFDLAVIQAIQGLENPLLTKMMVFFTTIGTGLPMIVIALTITLLLYLGLGHRREVILFIGVVLGSALLNAALKQIFKRARPMLHRIVEANGYSFPSGHSMAAFSLYGIAAFLLWKHTPAKWARVCLILASLFFILMIGISRIYLGVHYPSDVLGGYLASVCWLASSVWWYQMYLETHRPRYTYSQHEMDEM